MHLVQSATGSTQTSAASRLRSQAGSVSTSHPSPAATSPLPTRSTLADTAKSVYAGTLSPTKTPSLHTGMASTWKYRCHRTRERRSRCLVGEEITVSRLASLLMLAVGTTSGLFLDTRSHSREVCSLIMLHLSAYDLILSYMHRSHWHITLHESCLHFSNTC